MEKQLFDWTDWEEVNTGCYVFYGVRLVKDVGDWRKGTAFNRACVDYENGTLQLFKESGSLTGSSEYSLELRVLPRATSAEDD